MGKQTDLKCDEYPMQVAMVEALMSKCANIKVGAAIVNSRYEVISTGSNTPPYGFPSCSERYTESGIVQSYADPLARESKTPNDVQISLIRSGELCPRTALGYGLTEGRHLCPSTHAAAQAIANAAKNAAQVHGCKIYITSNIPCKDCMALIINSWIREIVVTDIKPSDQFSLSMAREAGVLIRKYSTNGSEVTGDNLQIINQKAQ